MKNIFYLFLFCVTIKSVDAQTIYSYTNNTSGAASSVATNATGAALSRVNGVTAPGSPCSSGFSSVNFSTTTTYSSSIGAVNVDVSPNVGYQLNVTSFSVGLRRSGTGPVSVRLAYSINGGSTWIDKGTNDAPSNASCGSTSTAAWTVSISTSATLKFRIYGFAGSNQSAGVMQVLNLSINGTVTSSTSSPTLSFPTVQNIDSTTATLGANVVSDNGSAVTGRGIVWATSSLPVIGQGGVTQLNIGGTTGAYSSNASSLPSGSRIYFRGFATNGIGTGYSTDTSFFTFSPQPANAVSNLLATAISKNDIQLSWTPLSDANGYVVLQQADSAPTALPQDGMRYAEGIGLGNAIIVDTILSANVGAATYSGLTSGTVYYYAVIPYRFNGSNVETYNYRTNPVPVAFDTTFGFKPSAKSDLAAITLSEAQYISSVKNDSLNSPGDGVQVWKLSLRDGGASLNDSDDMPTIMTRLALGRGISNTQGGWTGTLRFAALFDDSSATKLANGTIYNDSIVFQGFSCSAADNNQHTLSVRVSLKSINIRDNDTLHLSVIRNQVRVIPNTIGSQLTSAFSLRSDSSRNRINVQATRFFISQQPSNVRVNERMTPSFRIDLLDSNNNKDLDYADTVFIYSSKANFLNTPVYKVPAANSAGTLIFDSLYFGSIAQANQLKIKSATIDTSYSGTHNVYGSNQSDIAHVSSFVYQDSIPYLFYQEAADLNIGNSVPVFAFTLRDGGSLANDPDLFSTTLKAIRFSLTGNTYLRRLALYNGNTELADLPVNDSLIQFSGLNITANDNDSVIVTLRASFESRYAQGQRVTFRVKEAAADTATGSVFGILNAGGIISSQNGANNVLKYTQLFVQPLVPMQFSRCKGDFIHINLQKPVSSIARWYDSATAAVPFYTGDTLLINNLQQNLSYYVELDSAGWRSERSEVSVRVNIVSAPVVNNTEVCRANSAQLTAVSNGNSLSWYRTFLATDTLFIGNNFNTGLLYSDTLFYVQADSGSCKSQRQPVLVMMRKVTVPPLRDTLICKGTAVTFNLNNGTGASINWYKTAMSAAVIATGNTFSTGVLNTDTTFFVEADSASCKSQRLAVMVDVKQLNPPLLPTDSSSICSGNKALLLANESSRPVFWYSSAVSSSAILQNDSLETSVLNSDTVFYVEVAEAGCRSDRRKWTVIVNPTPVNPQTLSDSICSGTSAVLQSYATTGNNVRWYAQASGGAALFNGPVYNTPVLTSNTDYYLEFERKSCLSQRVARPVLVKNSPAAPLTGTATICSGNRASLGALASQGTIKWFSSLTDSNSIGSGDTLLTPVLQQTTVFYAAADLQSCQSSRQPALVSVNKTPDAGFTVNDSVQCLENNQFVFLNAINPSTTLYSWELGDSTLFAWANPVKSYTRKGLFQVKLNVVSNKGCSAESTRLVKVEEPSVDFSFIVNGRNVYFSSNLNGITSYQWYFTNNDSLSGPSSPTFLFPAADTYQVKLKVKDASGCSNSVSKLVQTNTTGISTAANSQLTVYPNPFAHELYVNYTLQHEEDVVLDLYDLQGRVVYSERHHRMQPGVQESRFDLSKLVRSVYFLKVQMGTETQMIKLIAQ